MQSLNPTLWRTCKMLAGRTRIKLLRLVFTYPGLGVTVLGRKAGIGHAAASQELRRIQSRGLLQAERQGSFVIYRLVADPQVPSAAPLLKSIQSAFGKFPPEKDLEICRIATGLSHERRIRIVRALLEGPRSQIELPFVVRIVGHPLQEHLKTLVASGLAAQDSHQVKFAVPDHPLAKALVELLRQGIAR